MSRPIGTNSSSGVMTTFRLPLETWRALKFQATRERRDMRDIVLRCLARELGEQQEQRARPAGAAVTKT
jgi:hypothetical protein